MTSIGTGYDLSASTYSPDGRIFQVEYATKAVENSGTAIGIKFKDGIILAVEKLVQSKLLVPASNRRIQTIERHMGMATAGLLADGRHLANRARDEATNLRRNYHYPATAVAVADRLSLYTQAYTLYSSVRPFGATAILGAFDKNGPALLIVEPSGIFHGYNGAAVGKGQQLAKTELEKIKFDEISARDAAIEAARIIHAVHDDSSKDKDFELEMSWICAESAYRHLPVPDELLKEANEKAKAALEMDVEEST